MIINWTHLIEKYKGMWVALKDDETSVVASGKTAKEAFQAALKKGYSHPLLTRVPDKLTAFVGAL
ncbi:MAG: DUF5678 domain-containing protein [Candidatus Pacebacteria bacterium]|nr:DUF5678 domain-containing protein [Candidatus Paceibacterota bacterium]